MVRWLAHQTYFWRKVISLNALTTRFRVASDLAGQVSDLPSVLLHRPVRALC